MLLPQLLSSVFISFAAVVAGIPCHMIGVPGPGYGYDDSGRRYSPGVTPASGILHPFIDPFTAGQGFDIFDTKDCLLRFQTPGELASSAGDWITQIAAARVTDAVWSATGAGVLATIVNAFGSSSFCNLKLWLQGDAEPYNYAGILQGALNTGSNTMTQPGLCDPSTVVSYLLPSGVQKVTTVGSNSGGGNEAVSQAMLAGITGINGNVDPNEDYAYSTVGRVSLGLKQQYDAGNLPPQLRDWPSEPGAYTTATKGNGDCVVIDFRNMKPYIKYVTDYPWSKMCPI